MNSDPVLVTTPSSRSAYLPYKRETSSPNVERELEGHDWLRFVNLQQCDASWQYTQHLKRWSRLKSKKRNQHSSSQGKSNQINLSWARGAKQIMHKATKNMKSYDFNVAVIYSSVQIMPVKPVKLIQETAPRLLAIETATSLPGKTHRGEWVVMNMVMQWCWGNDTKWFTKVSDDIPCVVLYSGKSKVDHIWFTTCHVIVRFDRS